MCQCLEGKHGIFDGGLWCWQGLWGGGGFIAPHIVCVLVVGSTHSANKGSVIIVSGIYSLCMVPRDVFENKFAFRGRMGFETKRETFCRIGSRGEMCHW